MLERRIRLLVWCPLVNRGGGERLLVRLVQALARQPAIELVRLAVPGDLVRSVNTANIPALQTVPITTVRAGSRLQYWLELDKRVLGIRGTLRLKRFVRKWALRTQDVQVWMHEQLWIASRDCDLVYAFWPHHQVFPSLDRPVVCTFQDATIFEFPEILGGAETQVEFHKSRAWLSGCSQVVVSSAATKDIMARYFGDSCSSAVVIRHAIVPEQAHEMKPLPPALHCLPDGYIVFPAHITPHKNHYNLLSAWSRLSGPSAPHLVMFGPGTEVLYNNDSFDGDWWHASRLRGLLRRTDLRDGRDYSALGLVQDSDVMPIIGGAAALIMPTLAEGGGSFPIEEALSLGVPVLCSDIPVLREQLADRTAKIGWFDPESPGSIAAAVRHLVQNYADYKEAALRAMNDVRPTWGDVAAQYVAVFREVVERTGTLRGR